MEVIMVEQATAAAPNIDNARDLADVSQALDQAIQGDTTNPVDEVTTQNEFSRNQNELSASDTRKNNDW